VVKKKASNFFYKHHNRFVLPSAMLQVQSGCLYYLSRTNPNRNPRSIGLLDHGLPSSEASTTCSPHTRMSCLGRLQWHKRSKEMGVRTLHRDVAKRKTLGSALPPNATASSIKKCNSQATALLYRRGSALVVTCIAPLGLHHP
jgi:hypothetical protein